jgi:hypothetical protein
MQPRRRRGPIVFMAVWLVIWGGAMLVALFMLGAALLRGDYGAAPFLVIWLGGAGVGLYAGVRRLQTLLGLAEPPRPVPQSGRHGWRDDMAGEHPAKPPGSIRPGAATPPPPPPPDA